ncbi:MAG: cation diffusion facilitator family transporter [Aristaeellaceae bacterium]
MLPILLNLCLGVFKCICGSISSLASISADAANNLSDALTSLLTALGVKVASTLGGSRHPNGHGRIEWVVGIVVSCSIMLVGWESLRDSMAAIRNPSEPEFHLFILLVMLVSIGIKLFLFFYNTRKSRESNSSAYKAAAADCISDAVSTSVVTVSFLVDSLLHVHIDGWCGVIVSLFIIRNGLKSFAEISRRVLGEVADEALSERLKSYVLAYDSEMIDEVVDLQLLDYGYERYGAFLTVRTRCDADKGKFLLMIADLKSDIYREFGYVATIEPEVPASSSEQERIKETVCRKIREIDEHLIVSDSTRVNEGAVRPQVVLSIAIPFKYSRQERTIYQEVQKKLEGEAFSYTARLTAGGSHRPSGRHNIHQQKAGRRDAAP